MMPPPSDPNPASHGDVGEYEIAVVERLLASMLGPEFITAVDRPRLALEILSPDERQHVARAVEKRQAEFGTARICARRMLSGLGIAPCSLVPNADRSPRWPEGIVGSITHTDGCCAVAMTNAPSILGLGIDVERDVPIETELVSKICTPAERSWLAHLDYGRRCVFGNVFFSAKEAAYKSQYALTRTVFGFQDIELAFDLSSQTFRVVALAGLAARWDAILGIKGKFAHAPGFILCTSVLCE